MSAAAAGDDRAFETLYRGHVRAVFRYALAVLGDAADAEDVTQTTFLNAYRAYRRGERPLRPEHWLIAIAHNACRERFRQAQRRPQEVTLNEELSVAAAGVDADAPTVQELRRALSQLPQGQRDALVMRELEGRAYAEIAGALGVSVPALETTLFRARRTLREQLDEQLSCSEASDAISKQLYGTLERADQRGLRAHLRRCPDCAHLARSRRAKRAGPRGLLSLPLPRWASPLFARGAGVTSTGALEAAGLTAKFAVLAGTAALAGGVYAGVTRLASHAQLAPLPFAPSPAKRPSHASPRRATVLLGTASPSSADGAGGHPPTPPPRTAAVSVPAAPAAVSPPAPAEGPATARGNAGGNGKGAGHAAAAQTPPGQAKKATPSGPASTGPPATPPGQAKKAASSGAGALRPPPAAPGQSGTAPGQSDTAPGQSDTAPGQSGTAPGQSGTAPGQAGQGSAHGKPNG